tara:strand:+ start:244 stop:795 length:552 start_codon:yes stop_codon:yes gene_type:complete
MPKVGDKNFAYTPEGKQAAEDYAMETNQEVIPTYDAGGRVQNIKGYGEAPVGASMLPEPNGEMTDEQAVKYLNPQAYAKEGGKITNPITSRSKRYNKKGREVKYIEVDGKLEEQSRDSKQVEKSRERDIKNQAKGIVSGKYKNLDVTNITKSVEDKNREVVKTHKMSKKADEDYAAKKKKKKK